MPRSVPVIDLFAGPGGLGEGFTRAETARFEIAVSIEKDAMAHETLRLRAAHRHLLRDPRATDASWKLWDTTLFDAPWGIANEELKACGDPVIADACRRAAEETVCLELGPESRNATRKSILERLAPYGGESSLPENAVLIGGPPCQAYSIVGRSRNKGLKDYAPENDHRHFLYREYLKVIAEFRPAVFVMENVKGILTSRVSGEPIFPLIMRDLRRPDIALGTEGASLEYELLPLPESDGAVDDPLPSDFIVRAEEYGVPQARHRVIIVGVRKDVAARAGRIGRLRRSSAPCVADVIGGLPSLRPQVSFRGAGTTWLDALRDPLFDVAVDSLRTASTRTGPLVADRLLHVRRALLSRGSHPPPGADRLRIGAGIKVRRPRQLSDWYLDRPSGLLANHESRAHMPTDLVRYIFVAAFGEVTGNSPRLSDFPVCLLPNHANVNPILTEASIFKDRFRVQVSGTYSMTVTSHIAKDGHAFIHPQAKQCRSLTVREAARLQTFPDSYVFLGNRTSQYTQVGNAVPPYLAKQIAELVGAVLKRSGLA